MSEQEPRRYEREPDDPSHEQDVAEAMATKPHLWSCGCLKNDAGAHRVGCPDHPEGVRGS